MTSQVYLLPCASPMLFCLCSTLPFVGTNTRFESEDKVHTSPMCLSTSRRHWGQRASGTYTQPNMQPACVPKIASLSPMNSMYLASETFGWSNANYSLHKRKPNREPPARDQSQRVQLHELTKSHM